MPPWSKVRSSLSSSYSRPCGMSCECSRKHRTLLHGGIENPRALAHPSFPGPPTERAWMHLAAVAARAAQAATVALLRGEAQLAKHVLAALALPPSTRLRLFAELMRQVVLLLL